MNLLINDFADMARVIQTMRDELTLVGVKELRTPEEVDQALSEKTGTTMVVFNSVCGCAAGNARPGVGLALQNGVIPDRLFTVFAG
ncbi:MAG: BrxA/BrxB family bacilliredoxin, partial [Candidatus Zixiibacteriota bacterium]